MKKRVTHATANLRNPQQPNAHKPTHCCLPKHSAVSSSDHGSSGQGHCRIQRQGEAPAANNIWVNNTKTEKKLILCSKFVTLGYYRRFGKDCGFPLPVFKGLACGPLCGL
jgi:hypothetical protein